MRTAPFLIAIALILYGCLESDEEIAVRPDGRVSVEVSAKAKAKDLADGYPVPFGGLWSAADEVTREWMSRSAAGRTSPAIEARIAGDDEIEIRVRAEFASVRELPVYFGPESDPYRTAYLERVTDLRVERKEGRTVYVLERTYHGRAFERLDVLSRVKAILPKELYGKLENDPQLDDGERAQIAAAAVEAMRAVAASFTSDACLSIYTQGDASLSPQAALRVRATVAEAIARVVTRERLDRIVAGVFPPLGREKGEGAEEDLEDLEKTVRETLRSSFERALQAEGCPAAARNAMRGELEWLFTARDHTDDLGDDSFRVGVRMPGTIVGGNYDEVADGAARWKFDGAGVRDHDRVLRVVSVVE